MSDPFRDSGSRTTPYTILIVDDNQQNLELIEAYMEELPDVRPITATNGAEALDAVASEHPDLILLDVMMPKISGFEVCKQVKGDPGTRDIPIIMVTALDEFGDVERARECGADGFLTKPVKRQELTAEVRRLLSARQSTSKAADRPKPDIRLRPPFEEE